MKRVTTPVEYKNNQRRVFADSLYNLMIKDQSIYLVTCDLGWGVFDKIRNDFPDRFFNVGASEQAGMGIAVGLALEGKKPFIYSITTFLLRRAYETIKLYIDYEKIPVRLVGGGRDRDYAHDGISHWAGDDTDIMRNFKNIKAIWPAKESNIESYVEEMVGLDIPQYINLRR